MEVSGHALLVFQVDNQMLVARVGGGPAWHEVRLGLLLDFLIVEFDLQHCLVIATCPVLDRRQPARRPRLDRAKNLLLDLHLNLLLRPPSLRKR